MVKPSGDSGGKSSEEVMSSRSFCRTTHVDTFMLSSGVGACAGEISGGLSMQVSKVVSSSFAESVSNSSTGAGSSSSIAGAVFASGTKTGSRYDAGADACAADISGDEAKSGAFMAGAEALLRGNTLWIFWDFSDISHALGGH